MTQIAAVLFAWDAVEARPDLERFYLVRDYLPDSDLIQRGTGFATPSQTFDVAVIFMPWKSNASGLALLPRSKRFKVLTSYQR